MKNVCFIGNSHLGAIKEGATALGEAGALKKINLDTFGSHRNSLKECTVENGIVHPGTDEVRGNFEWTSGGKTEIKLADYDALFIVAGYSVFSIDPLVAGAAGDDFIDVPPMTDDLLDEVFSGMARSWYLTLAQDIAKAAPKLAVTHVGKPYTSEEAPFCRAVLEAAEAPGSKLVARAEDARARLAKSAQAMGPKNLTCIAPPLALLEPTGLFTQKAYSRGSKRLHQAKDIAHPAEDFDHMNAAYGEALIRSLLNL